MDIFENDENNNNIEGEKKPTMIIPLPGPEAMPNSLLLRYKTNKDLAEILKQIEGKYILRNWKFEELKVLLGNDVIRNKNILFKSILPDFFKQLIKHQEGTDEQKEHKAMSKLNEAVKIYCKNIGTNENMAYQLAAAKLPAYVRYKVPHANNLIGKILDLAHQLNFHEGFVVKTNEPTWSNKQINEELAGVLGNDKILSAGNATRDERQAYIEDKKRKMANK